MEGMRGPDRFRITSEELGLSIAVVLGLIGVAGLILIK